MPIESEVRRPYRGEQSTGLRKRPAVARLPRIRTNPFESSHVTAVVDRDRALPLALALLAIVSLGLAAATLDSAVTPQSGSGFGGSDAGIGDDSPRTPTDENGSAADGGVDGQPLAACWPFLRQPPALLALAGFFVGLFALVKRETDSKLAGAAVCAAALVPVAIIWGSLAACPTPDPPDNESEMPTPTVSDPNGSSIAEGGSGAGFGDVAANTLSSPSVLVVLLFVLAVAVALVAIIGTRGDDIPDEEPDIEATPEAEDVAAVGRVAGTAADRIEADAAAENEVYRAWREMTDELAVEHPDSTTPGEFAEAAIAAGMDPDDVAELTDLFEAVRYGGLDVTEARERRAVETLRHIEETYGGER